MNRLLRPLILLLALVAFLPLTASASSPSLARYRVGEGTELYLTDRLGSVQDRMNLTGGVTNSLRYRAFGGVGNESGVGDRFKFTGREFDAETGLYYYRARYFDPRLGRFLSEDPLGFRAGDTNLSRYVGNSPGNGVDPTGMTALSEQSLLQKQGPTGAVVASQAAATAQREILITGMLEKVILQNRLAAEALSRADVILKITSTDVGFKLALTRQLRVVLGLGTAVFLTLTPSDTEDTTVTTLADGTEVIKTTLATDDGLTIEKEEVRKDGCNRRDPQPLYPKENKFKQHAPPLCKSYGKSCFRSVGEGIGLSLAAWSGEFVGGSGTRRQRCFRNMIGVSGSGWPRTCVTIVVDSNCRFHGWPSVKRNPGRED